MRAGRLLAQLPLHFFAFAWLRWLRVGAFCVCKAAAGLPFFFETFVGSDAMATLKSLDAGASASCQRVRCDA